MNLFRGLSQAAGTLANAAKETWKEFVVSCPDCKTTMIPPKVATELPHFHCVQCKALLVTPGNIERSMFFAELSAEKIHRKGDLSSQNTVMIEVLVPKGIKEGDMIEIVYKEVPYQVTVPQGKKEGEKFHIQLALPKPPTIIRAYIAKKVVLLTTSASPPVEVKETEEKAKGNADEKPSAEQTGEQTGTQQENPNFCIKEI